jgi:hypothetical protein
VSSDTLMVISCYEITRYTKIHIRYDVLISGKLFIFVRGFRLCTCIMRNNIRQF